MHYIRNLCVFKHLLVSFTKPLLQCWRLVQRRKDGMVERESRRTHPGMHCNHKGKCTLAGFVFCIEEKITAHMNDEEIYG